MATIDISHSALLALVERLQREHGITVVANFALDEQLNRADATIQQLLSLLKDAREDAAAVRAKLQEAYDMVDMLKNRVDPTRAKRVRRVKKVFDGGD